MPLQQFKPTSPGRRFVIRVTTPELHKGEPFAGLVTKLETKTGRNNYGRITTRHRGGGHKRRYRIIDFLRNKDGIAGKVERLEYDPNRTAHLALVLYADGERRYIIAPKGLAAGDTVMSGRDAAIKTGNTLPLRSIPVGTLIHCLELKPGKGAQLARAAGGGVPDRGSRGGLRDRAHALRRDAQDPRRVPRHHRRSRPRGAQPREPRQGRRASAGAACARRCAAWR